VSLNPTNGVLSWLFQSINSVTGKLVTYLMAGFLPPDNAAGQGEGSLTYTIAPAAGLSTGAQIMNQASIVFDANASIATPATTNTVDATPPVSSLAALPADSPATFTVAWAGTDVGSGIAGFNIYVSTNGGPWMAWFTGTTNTSAAFTGVAPDEYSFYSVAYDAVGNVESSPMVPGASTTVEGAGGAFTIARSGAESVTLSWPQGTLEEATNLLGPWVTNAAPSPYVISPTNQQMFFRVLIK